MQIDWTALFVPHVNLWEIAIRGSMMYLFLFVLFRVLRREAGSIGIADLLVVVLIADAAQNALGSEYKSVTEGAVLVLTIVGWDFLLDWLGYRFPTLRPIFIPRAVLLIKNGRMIKRNIHKEMISEEEIFSAMREHEVENLADVKLSCLESDGKISIVKKEKK
jgi:uncharacterized membrane protein YcaP (DUF421 family)